jgi:hypothetical protein
VADRRVERSELAAAGQGEQADARIRVRADNLVGAIGRAVGHDEHLEPVGEVVEREQVVDPCPDDVLLVVRRDDHRHARLIGLPPDASSKRPRKRRSEERVPDVSPDDPAEAEPEQDLDREHAVTVTAQASNPAGNRLLLASDPVGA